MDAFDPLEIPLRGRYAIEASAGTGKTYTIAALYIRLLIERGWNVDEILVVTFTEAATHELRDRIRRRLRETLDAFSRGSSGDPILKGLLDRVPHEEARGRLLRALHDFDEAAISTIHGFCHRVLQKRAFRTGAVFDAELVGDETALRDEVATDHWRGALYGAPRSFVEFALSEDGKRDDLVRLFQSTLNHPEIEVVTGVEAPSARAIEALDTDRARLFDRLRNRWTADRTEVTKLLGDSALDKRAYGKDSVATAIGLMDDLLHGKGGLDLPQRLERLTPRMLAAKTKGNHAPPSHPFFDAWGAFWDLVTTLHELHRARLLAVKRDLIEQGRAELARRKRRQNVLSFGDLLTALERALRAPHGRHVALELLEEHPVALIDESQDTDPTQYEIFRSIYEEGSGLLFFIADPKQAIYGFRGADVFAYASARESVDARYTLGTNWRSDPRLVGALNHLFSRSRDPFVFPQIAYHPVTAAERQDRSPLEIDGRAPPPLDVWLLEEDGGATRSSSMSKTNALAITAEAVTSEVVRLLRLARDGRALLDGRPLLPDDIAILVRKNAHAWRLQETLRNRGVPSVLYSGENLFQSPESCELERLLTAMADPHDHRAARAALATDLLGVRAEEIADLESDGTSWERWVAEFHEAHSSWNRYGVLYALRLVLERHRVRERLLGRPDGERRVTNVLHLAEVLHRAETQGRLGPTGAVRWLAERRRRPADDEEHEIRLETDEHAVKLVTVHKAKGLEYPVVFCATLWDRRVRDPTEALFHDPDDRYRLKIDLRPRDEEATEGRWTHRALAKREQLAEEVRLLYVALTRASHRAYLVWAPTREPGALEHVIGVARRAGASKGPAGAGELAHEVGKLAEDSGGAISAGRQPAPSPDAYRPARQPRAELRCRTFPRTLATEFRIASFSSLASRARADPDAVDRDAPLAPPPPEAVSVTSREGDEELSAEPEGIFAFPAGARAGTLLHEILEELVFERRDAEADRALVSRKLAEHGFEDRWEDVVLEMLGRVLSAPLGAAGSEFRLDELSRERRRSEVEFHFPLSRIEPRGLRRVLGGREGIVVPDGLPREIGRLEFHPTSGFMKGYIDLVCEKDGRFYIVDWKSNLLGHTLDAYAPTKLEQVMVMDLYTLQYLIYSVALGRHLSTRLPGYRYEEHFGGVLYIFLRGVDPVRAPGHGIYSTVPPAALIEELDSYLAPRAGEEAP